MPGAKKRVTKRLWFLARIVTLMCCTACNASKNDTPSASTSVHEGACQLASDAATPEFLKRIGCSADFAVLAAQPVDADLPGAQSTKVVIDTADGDALYFQNSQMYKIHYEFASAHLSGNGLPLVPQLAEFNASEYYSPERRFLLGAVTYYQDPKVWALEVAPYDTASAAQITRMYKAVRAAAFFGPGLVFHPTSDNVAIEAKKLAASVATTTTAELYADTSYQPLTLGSTVGRLHFTTAANLSTEYLPYEDIVVLDEAPNDITVVRGLFSQQF
jgi:hypothetical protein